jgi:hypothetical protein
MTTAEPEDLLPLLLLDDPVGDTTGLFGAPIKINVPHTFLPALVITQACCATAGEDTIGMAEKINNVDNKQ